MYTNADARALREVTLDLIGLLLRNEAVLATVINSAGHDHLVKVHRDAFRSFYLDGFAFDAGAAASCIAQLFAAVTEGGVR
jgi:hypothetical protein